MQQGAVFFFLFKSSNFEVDRRVAKLGIGTAAMSDGASAAVIAMG